MANEIRDSRFRYVDAGDLENTNVDFGDLDVRNPEGDKIGEVDGFIVDATSERPYYVVVDSGGWFRGGKYLVPINHTRLDRDEQRDEDVMLVDLNKDTIKQYPKFDKDEFARLSDAQLRDFQARIDRVCCPGQTEATTVWSYESLEHYRQPGWWTNATGPRTVAVGDTAQGRTVPPVPPARPTPPPVPVRSEDRERVIAREDQPAGDRAEPGDVLGIESGGEETHLGDTPADERRRVTISDREAREAEKNTRG